MRWPIFYSIMNSCPLHHRVYQVMVLYL